MLHSRPLKNPEWVTEFDPNPMQPLPVQEFSSTGWTALSKLLWTSSEPSLAFNIVCGNPAGATFTLIPGRGEC